MYVIKLKNMLFALCGVVVLSIIFNVEINNKKVLTNSESYTKTIVIDAGHGLPDGGASQNGVIESKINLTISKKLEEELMHRGYDVIMTRKDENNIADADKQSKVSEMKKSDLENRVKIINESGADFCVSIHINKFKNEKYWGWQTFYNKDSESGKKLANIIQENITKSINKNNKRTALKIEGIKIVDKTNIPVVIVECGFISNAEEVKLLQSDDYIKLLVNGISNGIDEFYD